MPGEAPPEEEMLPPPESSESEFPAENSTEAPADDNLLPTETDGESGESEEELTEANLETVESETESDGETLTFGRIFNETTIEVYTYDELKQALSGDNGYTTIYLGDNITADGTGIDIHPNKTDVIIDGAPPEGGRYRFTQYVSANDSTSIRVRSAGIQSVTLRNLDIHGANYYGVVWVPDSISGIVIIHENVDYTGPQPVYNRSGTTRLADSTYTLRPVSGMSGEIAETMHAEFSGTIHISAAGTNHPVLQLTSSVSTLTVLDGAEVTVNTDYGFLGTNGQTPTSRCAPALPSILPAAAMDLLPVITGSDASLWNPMRLSTSIRTPGKAWRPCAYPACSKWNRAVQPPLCAPVRMAFPCG